MIRYAVMLVLFFGVMCASDTFKIKENPRPNHALIRDRNSKLIRALREEFFKKVGQAPIAFNSFVSGRQKNKAGESKFVRSRTY